MRGFLTSLGRSRSGDETVRAGRTTRAVLATAIAASLLLPFAGGAPTIVAAAAGPGVTESTVRPAQLTEGMTRLALIPGESEARYIMTITTLGQPPKQAACSTRAVTGEIVLAPDGSVVQELSKIALDQRTLKCAAPLRDAQAQNLLQTKVGITRLRGRFYEYRDIPVLCTFHPAALLEGRSPEKKKDVWDDMKMLLAKLGRPVPGTRAG